VSGLLEVATWLVYAVAAVMMLSVIAAAILSGLGLRLVAEFLRGLGDAREEGDTQHAEDGPRRSRVDDKGSA
jgi:putative Mn2+ efflux pump MntP